MGELDEFYNNSWRIMTFPTFLPLSMVRFDINRSNYYQVMKMVDRKASMENESNNNIVQKNDTNTTSEISSPIIDLEIQDIEGIGPTTAKKLKEAGIVSVMDLAVASSDELAVDLNSSKDSAASFIMAAQKLLRDSNVLEKEFVTADAALEKRKSMLRCSTGSIALDDLLLGGIETQAVTEFYGEFGSGKSQICHTLCATARQPIAVGGLDGGVIYIDTEGTFRPERVEQIARARGFDPSQILKSVAVCKIYNSSHLELIIKDLGKYINDFKAKLVVIDSIISLHRAEFAGRGTLADRQQRLNNMLHKLVRLTEIYNIAIVITNQVQSSPDTFFGDPTKAAGGNVLGHASTYRIYLRKSGENRVAKMIDSPYHPYSETRFTVNEKGTDDIEEQIKKGGRKLAKDEDEN
ncbi:MAG: DNA repair and recombination protein RadA [Thermoproteota archaeon]|nr:DNA repair and recombination protein RadA [Thermoproteota archaeon]